MFVGEYDYNLDMEAKKEDGRIEKALEAAINLYANGVSIDIIAKSLNMTEEEVKEIVSQPSPAN